MATCHDMKEGEIYVCGECGLELKVLTECTECGTDEDTCECPPCTIVCCGETLQLKEEE